jgi:sugar phosphate isomerase/epimerase
MRIGQSSPTFCHSPIADVAAQLAADKFPVWEIFGEGRHFLPEHEQEFSKILPSHSFDVQLHCPISDVNIGSLNRPQWEMALRIQEETLAAAARLGIERVTIHPGNHTPLSRGHYGKVHEQTRQAIRRLDTVCLELGLTPCLENMAFGWAFETVSLDQLLDLTQGTEFSYCLDIGHAFISKRLEEFYPFANRLGNVHIHDNLGVMDDHMTLNQGKVPWQDSVRALQKGGYRGTYVIESRDFASGRESQRLLQAELAKAA